MIVYRRVKKCMQLSLSQRAHLPTAVPGLEKAPVQNLILHISQQNPKASSIHYPESNPRVLFMNVKNTTFKGEGMWNSCWQLRHYPNYTKLPSSRELWLTMPRLGTPIKPGRPRVAVAAVALNIFALKGMLLSYSCSAIAFPWRGKHFSHWPVQIPPSTSHLCTHRHPWRFAIQTDWVGQRQWQDKVSRGITANSQTGGGCWLL